MSNNRRKDQNTLILGDWNVICPMCGWKYKASEMVRRWDGQMVCSKDVDPYHPQDLIRGVSDDQTVPFTRPEGELKFLAKNLTPDDYP